MKSITRYSPTLLPALASSLLRRVLASGLLLPALASSLLLPALASSLLLPALASSPLLPALASSLLLLGATTPSFAQGVDLAKSQISFGFKQENVPGEGRFRKFSAQVAFDPAWPETTMANIEVDVTSVDLGDAGWNTDIQSPSWFDTARYPKATFVAGAARALGGGRFEAPAKFTLKGVTRNVMASFTAKADAGGILLEGVVPLKRNDYKMGEGPWSDVSVVANEVAVRFKVYVKKK